MEVKNDIDLYFGYLNNHLDSIRGIGAPKYSDLYKKLCYIGFIDLLSSLVYPKKSNRERIVSTLKQYSKWAEGYKISLPHLLRLLNKITDPKFDELRLFASAEYKQWNKPELVELSSDLPFEVVKKMWPRDNEYKTLLDNVSLDSLTHFHLFYTYRNSLVHTLRAPTTHLALEDIEYPFYAQLTSLRFDSEQTEYNWILHYPVNFIDRISTTLYEEIREYYIALELNPYDMFNVGHYWLDSLNKK